MEYSNIGEFSNFINENPMYALNSSFNQEKGFKISVSYPERRNNYVSVLELNEENKIYEINKQRIEHVISNTMWIPDTDGNYPELLAVASNDLSIFKQQETELIFKCSFFDDYNDIPIISSDWNPHDPKDIVVLQNNSKCYLCSIQSERIERDEIPLLQHEDFKFVPACKIICFGNGTTKNTVFGISGNGLCICQDLRKPYPKIFHNFKYKPFEMKYSIANPHFLGIAFENFIEIVDVRVPILPYDILTFDSEEVPNSISWSSYYDAMAIGTTTGRTLLWKLNAIEQSVFSYTDDKIQYIYSINCPPLKNNIILSTGRKKEIQSRENTNQYFLNVLKLD